LQDEAGRTVESKINQTNQTIKSRRGGKRSGAGRKLGSIERVTAIRQAREPLSLIKGSRAERAVTAAGVLGIIDEAKAWLELLKDKSGNVRLAALTYLTDRRDGKPKQAVEMTGKDGAPLQPPTLVVNFVKLSPDERITG
jgi:HEAT repeat protein